MEQYVVQGSSLTAVADAIRAKTKGTAALSPEEMAAEISKISSAKFVKGTFTPRYLDSNPSLAKNGWTVNHNLGTTPNFALLWCRGEYAAQGAAALICHDNSGRGLTKAFTNISSSGRVGLTVYNSTTTMTASSVTFKMNAADFVVFCKQPYGYLIGVIT